MTSSRITGGKVDSGSDGETVAGSVDGSWVEDVLEEVVEEVVDSVVDIVVDSVVVGFIVVVLGRGRLLTGRLLSSLL